MRILTTIGTAVFGLLAPALLLSGCSANFGSGSAAPGQASLGTIAGRTFGGQQPIVGSHVYAYQTSTLAYGGAATSLIGAVGLPGYTPVSDGTNYYVPTDGSGQFAILSTTPCTVGTVVYLYAVNGDPGAGQDNSSAGLLAVLGVCPASGVLSDSIAGGPNTPILVNEVSTVSAAYALSGFAVDATHIGAPTTAVANGPVTNTLAQTGIQNAGATAAQIYPESPYSVNSTTPNGNGTVPQLEINTLGNILAACINSASPFNSCASLFSDIKSAGATGTTATDTATAAIYIAHNPSTNVSALYNLVGSTANPFAPALTAVPANFTVTLSFTAPALTASNGNGPHNVAIDGSGNVWANTNNNLLCKFTPLGVLVSPTCYSGNALSGPTSIAIDSSSSYVWVADFAGQPDNGFVVSRFTTAGDAASNFTPGGTGIQDAELDASGNVWIDTGSNQLDELSSAGAVLATATGNDMFFPNVLAIQSPSAGAAAGTIWLPNINFAGVSVFTNAAGVYSASPITAGSSYAYAAAVDAGNNVWTSNVDGSISAFGSDGTPMTGSPFATGATPPAVGGTTAGDGLEIDGAGNVWMTSEGNNTVYELNNAGANLSGTAGFALQPTAQPDGLAIDGSGNVWFDTYTDATLREMVGAATPVATPLAYAVANSKLGQRP